MGQAKNRGTPEERKAAAIKDGFLGTSKFEKMKAERKARDRMLANRGMKVKHNLNPIPVKVKKSAIKKPSLSLRAEK